MANQVRASRDQVYAEIEPLRLNDDLFDSAAKAKLHRGQRGFFRANGKYTLSVLSNGGYEDQEDEDGALYQFPQSHRPSHDESDVRAAENCWSDGIPIFYIQRVGVGPARYRIHYPAWVTAVDHNSQLMLIEFAPVFRPLPTTPPAEPFVLRETKAQYRATAALRAGQARFRMACALRYGMRCALCDNPEKAVLVACHLYPYAEQGSDDARNGLILCANHHLLFDKGLIQFSDSAELSVREDTTHDRFRVFGVVRPSLHHLPNLPAAEALHAARAIAHRQNKYADVPAEWVSGIMRP